MESYPPCPKCKEKGKEGVLVPLSDTSYDIPRIEVRYRVWACTNPSCDFEISLRSGVVQRGAFVRDQKPR